MPKTKEFEGLKIMTPAFRASFVTVFNPKLPPDPKPGDKPKYSVVMLFDKNTDISALREVANAAAAEKFGSDLPKNFQWPFQDGDDKEYDGYEGMIAVRASSDRKPGLVDRENVDIIAEEDFYSGCYARATIVAFAYGGKGKPFKPGVSFGLRNIQKIRDGVPLGGGASAESDFGDADLPDLPDGAETTDNKTDDFGF